MDKKNKLPGAELSQGNMDHPEQFATKKENILDQYESEQSVDSLPLEDLKIEQREEKYGEHTKDKSATDKRYKTGF